MNSDERVALQRMADTWAELDDRRGRLTATAPPAAGSEFDSKEGFRLGLRATPAQTPSTYAFRMSLKRLPSFNFQ